MDLNKNKFKNCWEDFFKEYNPKEKGVLLRAGSTERHFIEDTMMKYPNRDER